MFVQIPAPITLKERDGKPMTVAGLVDGKTQAVEHKPESLHDFVDGRLASQVGTFKEERIWRRILKLLAEAEEKRAAGEAEPWVDFAEEDLKFFLDKMEAMQMGGHGIRQFAPFREALVDAKREKPKATLHAVADTATPKTG